MNPPEDDDHRNPILERWWPGLLSLAFWSSLILFFFVAKTCIQTTP